MYLKNVQEKFLDSLIPTDNNDNAFKNNGSKVILFKCFYIYRERVFEVNNNTAW
jgi:hypothetical protein